MKKAVYTLASGCATLLIAWAAIAATTVALPGRTLQLYSSQGGDDLTQTFRKAIDSAERSITLFIYHLNDSTLIRSLNARAASGVEVVVIYDGDACPQLHSRLSRKVTQRPHHGKGLMHRKILIVDATLIFAGSANMTPYSLRLHDNLVMGLRDRAMAAFVEAAAATGGTRTFTIGKQQVEIWMVPTPGAEERLIALIDTARSSVRVAMFTWTHYGLAHAVARAKLRGVKAEVLIDRNSSQGASAQVATLLAKKGVPTYRSSGDALLHHKFLWIDNHTLINGSANWTRAAFTQNRDCFMIIHNLTHRQQQQMEQIWQTARSSSTPFPLP